ncbi:MAG: hypothetical protein ACJASQ_002455 [Crocinitomicaceae bacterium]|jgi:hypothetical protein
MIKSQHIITLLLCTLILLGCKKDEPIPCQETRNENCEDIQNVKHFFYFKVGSWWVYEEETSGDLDTVYVTEASENPSNYDFDVRMYSSYQDFYYHFWPETASVDGPCPSSGSICQRCLLVQRSKYRPGVIVYQAKCFLFIPNEGDLDFNYNTLVNNNKVSVDQIDSTFFNGTLQFERTVKMHEMNTVMEGYQPTNHYFSENVGLTRKELIDSNQVWNLVDFYIEP